MATGIRNQKLFCDNCGDEKTLVYPISITDMTNAMESFEKRHKNCKPEWTQPKPNENMTTYERMDFWMTHGERGKSSETMYAVLSNQPALIGSGSFPHDPDDFKRCYGLLEMIPEWKSELNKLKRLGPTWKALVENWDKLTEMYEQNIKENWKNADKIGMYEFMKQLGC